MLKRDMKYYNDWAKSKGFKDRNEYQRNQNHKNGVYSSMSENKECNSYLGIHIAERLLPNIFGSMIRMPNNNIGYDVTCGKGFKIDIKSSCLRQNHNILNSGWAFQIRKNKIADYFLLLAFDNREDLTPLHIWLIKGEEIITNQMGTSKLNDKNVFGITNSIKTLSKYWKYEKTDKLDKLKECCNSLKDDI